MSEWRAKRFWSDAKAVSCDGGYTVELDGRPVKTPAKAALTLPTQGFADAVAAEWMGQDKDIDPLSMPYTRTANAAIDKVTVQREEIIDMLADYGDSDLLCYRADGPESLTLRQSSTWDPALAWAKDALGATLLPRTGVMHVRQDDASLKAIRTHIARASTFQLTALHDLIMLSGSAVLGLAAAEGWKTPLEIWEMSILDETWQAEQWGHDDEAAEQSDVKKKAFLHAKSAYDLSAFKN